MPNETIVAVFKDAAHADAAVRALEKAGVPSSAIERHSKGGQRPGSDRSENAGPATTGFFFWDMMFGLQAAHPDRSDYEQSLGRGETVVAVTVAQEDADVVVSILEAQSPIDVQEPDSVRERGEAESAEHEGRGQAEAKRRTREEEESAPAEENRVQRKASTRGESAETEEEEVIPLGEEKLEVGKRRVNKGTTRIRRYVVETPVEKPVSLHDERVVVERRKPAGSTAEGDALTEKTVEVTESSEEPVVEKTARLNEEVVVRREGRDRTATVRDTVRRDEIAVEDAADEKPARRKAG
jgi:uncharacterized protein (TIGR02271 family)